MVAASARGWGHIGAPGSSAGRAYQRNNIVTVRAGGVALPVHKEVAFLFEGFVNEIVERGYNLDRVRDDWGYIHRYIAGTKILSNHSWGLAIDLNATKNPLTTNYKVVTDMPFWVIQAAHNWGLSWGGSYTGKKKDPMHFEFMGSLEDARRKIAALKKFFESLTSKVGELRFLDGSGWVLHSDGGVFTEGAAPFFGSYHSLPAQHKNDPNRKFKSITWRDDGKFGYMLTSTRGEKYRFPL